MFEFIPASSICARLSIKVESEVFIKNPESPNKQTSNLKKKATKIDMDSEHPETATKKDHTKLEIDCLRVIFWWNKNHRSCHRWSKNPIRLSNLGSFCNAAAAKEAITLGLK